MQTNIYLHSKQANKSNEENSFSDNNVYEIKIIFPQKKKVKKLR